MELREKLRHEPDSLKEIAPLKLPDFTLLGHEIPLVAAETSRTGERRKPAQARNETLHLWASS
jgi:hypothetical protein